MEGETKNTQDGMARACRKGSVYLNSLDFSLFGTVIMGTGSEEKYVLFETSKCTSWYSVSVTANHQNFKSNALVVSVAV